MAGFEVLIRRFAVACVVALFAIIPSLAIGMHNSAKSKPMTMSKNIVVGCSSKNRNDQRLRGKSVQNVLGNLWSHRSCESKSAKWFLVRDDQRRLISQGCFLEKKIAQLLAILGIAGHSDIFGGSSSRIGEYYVKLPRLIQLWDAVYTFDYDPRALIQFRRSDRSIQGSLALCIAGVHGFLALSEIPPQGPSISPQRFVERTLALLILSIQRRLDILSGGDDLICLFRSAEYRPSSHTRSEHDYESGDSRYYIRMLATFEEFPKSPEVLSHPYWIYVLIGFTICIPWIAFTGYGLILLYLSLTREGTWGLALIGLLFIAIGYLFCHFALLLLRKHTVPQKYELTSFNYRGTVIAIRRAQMANVLPMEKKVAVISALAEGAGIRQTERMTGVNRETIMHLGVRVGKGCAAILDQKMRGLSCRHLQFDEIWGFIGKKERHLRPEDDPTLGDVWTFCAIDSDTKIVPSFKVGKRDIGTANAFVADVAARMANRVQISADALGAYVTAIEKTFGDDVDFAQIIKTYTNDDSIKPERKFSAPEVVITEKRRVVGRPNMRLASTSHIERLNGTTRLHMRRLTRLTYAFSKKLENFEAATALHFAYYNFVKRHNTLRVTPAMEAGIERDFWTVENLVEVAA